METITPQKKKKKKQEIKTLFLLGSSEVTKIMNAGEKILFKIHFKNTNKQK